MKERDIDTEIKEVWKQLSDERKKISLLYGKLNSAQLLGAVTVAR